MSSEMSFDDKFEYMYRCLQKGYTEQKILNGGRLYRLKLVSSINSIICEDTNDKFIEPKHVSENPKHVSEKLYEYNTYYRGEITSDVVKTGNKPGISP